MTKLLRSRCSVDLVLCRMPQSARATFELLPPAKPASTVHSVSEKVMHASRSAFEVRSPRTRPGPASSSPHSAPHSAPHCVSQAALELLAEALDVDEADAERSY